MSKFVSKDNLDILLKLILFDWIVMNRQLVEKNKLKKKKQLLLAKKDEIRNDLPYIEEAG